MKHILTLLTMAIFLATNSHALNDLYNEDRILQPFHMEGKLCNPNNLSWDDVCEDFLFQSIFGEEWEDIKKAVLAFQKSVVTKDPKYLEKYLELPMAVRFIRDPDHMRRINHIYSSMYVRKIFTLEELKKYVLDKLPDHLVTRIRNTKYKDIRFENGSAYVMPTGTKKDVVLIIDHDSNREAGEEFRYIPKIDRIELDFEK